MRKTITLFLVSLFMVGQAFAQNRVVPEGRNYKEVDHLNKQKTVVFENKDIQSKDGVLEVEGFEDVTETWPGGWETASSSDLSGANWTPTDFASGDNTWFVCTPESFSGDGGDYIYEGERSAAIGYTAGQSGNSMHWLVSKEVELPTDTAFLSFMTWFTSSSADGWFTYFYVQIEVDGTWENLLSWNTNDESHNNQWESVVDIDLTDYLGQTVRFGFVYEYNDGFQMALDSIAYMNVPPADDAGISKILTPESGAYEAGDIDVEVVLKNYGADTLTSVDINWGIETEGYFNLVSTESWTGELPQGVTDTIAVGSNTFSEYGGYKIVAYTSEPNGKEDINTANDTASVSIDIYEPGQLFEDYEEGDFAWGWDAEGNWTVDDYQPYDGMYHAELGHDSYSPEYKMITPRVHIDGTIPEISFYAGGLNNEVGYGSSKLQLMYSVDGEDWEAFGPQIDFAETGDAYQKYSVDLEIPAGDYYIAFSATSDFYYYGMYYSFIFIDNVTGPFLAAPQPEIVVPEDGETGVALDAFVGVLFDQAIDSADFSGITIVGENEGEVGNVVAELDPDFPAVIIYHDPFTGNAEEYTVTIPAGTVTNGAGFNEEITWTFTTIMPAPEVEVLSPVNQAEGVALDADVSVIFNQEIFANNLGSISMEGTLQGSVTNVNAFVNTDGKTVVITHDDFMEFEDTITVTMPAGAVENKDGVTNSEITWEFYLMSEGQPVADSLAPANNETGVALDAEVLIRFDTEVAEGDLSGVTIEGATQGTVANVEATLTDSTIHIAHDAFANNNELYTVTIPAGAVSSVATSQLNAEIKWNFTSIKAAPQLVEMIPANGATKVALDQEIIFSFDQKVNTDYDLDTLITIIGENEDTVEIIGWPQTANDDGFIIIHNGMEYNNSQYTVTVPAGIIYNTDGVMNTDEVSWTFT
ncbi:MAG: Ig-like domain-containing protein, partial [Bacteroidales bacterium]